MDAKRIAQKRASDKQRKIAKENNSVSKPKPQKAGLTNYLTSYDELISGYETAFVKTTSGKTFEIQSIDPGIVFILMGTPVMSMLSNKGADMTDANAVNKAIQALSIDEKVEVSQNELFNNLINQTICEGVVSVHLVNKPQYECDPDKKELSVNLLSKIDQTEIFEAIMGLIKPDRLQELAEFFRQKSEEKQNGDSEDSPDGESVSSETLLTFVPEGTE
jgi:hypothetical protein